MLRRNKTADSHKILEVPVPMVEKGSSDSGKQRDPGKGIFEIANGDACKRRQEAWLSRRKWNQPHLCWIL